MDERDVPKYRKRKRQNSKAAKRSDHKHQYEKSLLLRYNMINGEFSGCNWATHCAVCGRRGDFNPDDNDFRKLEYKEKHLLWCAKMYLTPEEILKKFTDVPAYRSDPNDYFAPDIRIR